MRKRNIIFLCDTIFWYLVYFLPIILYGIYMINATTSGVALVSMSDFVANTIRTIVNDNNPIFIVLKNLFSSNGIVPLFKSNQDYILSFLAYFSTMVIIHLCVDFLLFIPRLCHKWLDMYSKGVEK